MKRRTLIRLILLLVALGAARFVWRSSDSTKPAVSEARSPAPSSTSDESPSNLVAPVSSPTSDRAAIADSVSPPTIQAPAADVLVRVIDKDSRAPVADALVRWVDWSSRTDWPEDTWIDRGVRDRQLAEHGREFKTDARGEVRVPRVATGAHVNAEFGEFFGESAIEAQTEVVLELVADGSISAQVFDVDGHPVGGAVVVLCPLQGAGKLGDLAARAVTRPEDGLAVIRHARSTMKIAPSNDFEVVVDAVLAEPLAQRVSRENWPTTPLRFDLPATGSVEVRVLDARGAPISDSFDARIWVPDHHSVSIAERSEYEGQRTSSVQMIRSGSALFPFVGLGLDLSVRAEVETSMVKVFDAVGPGPTRRDERVRFDLGSPANTPYLAGRLIDEHGAPLAGFAFAVRLGVRHESSTKSWSESISTRGATSSEGRFEIALQARWSSDCSRHLWFTNRDRSAAAQITGDLAVDGELRLGINDIGDIPMRVPPLIASGRVVDESGAPVSGAWISVVGRDAVQLLPAVMEEPEPSTTCDAEGRFTLRGSPARSTVELRATQSGFLVETPRAVAVGSEALEFTLRRAATIDGFARVDAALERGDIVVSCRSKDAKVNVNTQLASTEDSTRWKFSLQNVAPGTYEFEFLARSGASLLRLDDVVAKFGARDPRLDDVDLRGLIHVFVVRVVDANGAAPEFALVRTRPVHTDGQWLDAACSKGLLRVLDTVEALDLIVSAPGHRTARVPSIRGDTTVQLKRGLPVRVVLSDPSIVPSSPARLIAELHGRRVESDPMIVDWRSFAVIGSDGSGTLAVDHDGTYDVRWSVERPSAHGVASRDFTHDLPSASVDVSDADDEQTFTLTLDRKVVENAVVELGKSNH